MKKHHHQRSRSPVTFEHLESRQMLSASSAIKPDTTFATTTGLFISSRTTTLGQDLTIKATVASAGGNPHGTVELLSGNKDTGLTGSVNHLGYYVFDFNSGNALFIHSYEFRIRYLAAGDFAGSISRNLSAKVVEPKFTDESDGLALATVTTGSGKADAAGEQVTVKYTGYNAATGVVFDNSDKDSTAGTFPFVLDADPESVIPGFDQEVTGMKIGETRVAIIPEQLGYQTGTSSALAGDTLVFVVQLVAD